MHLKIIDFINQNKNWRDILSEAPYYLSIKDDGEYTILKYNQISSDFSNDYVKESRGLIRSPCRQAPCLRKTRHCDSAR